MSAFISEFFCHKAKIVLAYPQMNFTAFISQYASDEWVLIAQNYTSIKPFKCGERIINEGNPVDGIYFINNGKVKVVSSYDSDNERILRFSKSGDLLGHRALSSATYPISATALTDTEVTFIPKEIFLKLVRTNPDFSVYILEFLARELSETEERMKSIIHNEVIVRIGIIICMLIDAYGYDQNNSLKLAYTLSRRDIASFAGTSYESVIRNLSKLDEQEIIKLEGKSILIPNESVLRNFLITSTHRKL